MKNFWDIFLFDTKEEVKLFHSVDSTTSQAHSLTPFTEHHV